MIELKQLDQSLRLAFEELLSENWQQNWSREIARQIIQWRYYERPEDAVTWLAMDGSRCVGMLDSMVRAYILNHQRVRIRETADWYCTPKYRGALGLSLLRQAMQRSEPVFVLGGSNYTLHLLPRLHWTVLAAATGYVFPIKARGLLSNLVRQRWWQHEGKAKLIPNFLPAKIPKRIRPPAGRHGRIELLDMRECIVDLPIPPGDGLVQLFEPQHWAWIANMPPILARPLGAIFLLDEEIVGFSLSQIEPTAAGFDAKIVYLQSSEDTAMAWIVSETTRLLADHEAGFIRCCVTTPVKTAAMEQVGYMKSREVPCHWWPGKTKLTPTSTDVGILRGDDAMPFQALRGRQLIGGIRVSS